MYLFEDIEQILQPHWLGWTAHGDRWKVQLSRKCNRGRHSYRSVTVTEHFHVCTSSFSAGR